MPTVNKIELQKILRITAPTLSHWMTKYDQDFPILEQGGRGRDWSFDVEAVLSFLAEREEEEKAAERERQEAIDQLLLPLGHNGGPTLEAEPSGLRPGDLLTLMKVRRLQREEAQACGRLVDSAELTDALHVCFSEMRRHLEAVVRFAADELGLSRESSLDLRNRLHDAMRASVDDFQRKYGGQTLPRGAAPASEGSAAGPLLPTQDLHQPYQAQ